MASLLLSIVGPDRAIADETVASAVLPGREGYLGVMAGHVPLIAALRAGVLEYVDLSGVRHHVYIGGGFAEVRDGKLIVLADEAAAAKDLDAAEAERSLDEARRALRGESNNTVSSDAVEEVERAMHRLRAARQDR